MKYVFIKEHSKQFSITLMCQLFKVSRSGFYAYNTRPLSNQQRANDELDKKITAIFNHHKKRYRAPRITRVLQSQKEPCSHTRVARRMKQKGLMAVAKKKFKVTTDSDHHLPVYNNVLNRDFSTTAINQKWARAVIGWSMNQRMKKSLVCDALMMALFKRKFPKQVIVHSDRGSQYCSNKYQTLLKDYRLMGSMSRKGNCWDNAIAESFFHTLKVELIHQCIYTNREQARQSIFQYLEVYYNKNRMHSAIDYRTPFEFEWVA